MKSIYACGLILISLATYAQTDKETVISTVQKPTIEGHIYFLASDELKGRETGSPEINIAAKYLATTFMRYGVKPVPGADGYYQEMKFKKTTAPDQTTLYLDDKGFSDAIALTHQNLDKAGEAVFIGYGLEDDYKKAFDYKDKILIASAGTAEDSSAQALFKAGMKKRALAEAVGAAALIEIYNFDSQYWQNVKGHFSHGSFGLLEDQKQDAAGLLHLWVNATKMPDLKKVKKAKVLVSGIEKNTMPSYNIVGMVEGTDEKLKDEYVIYSAHYDHLGVGKPNAEGDSIYNGARDNAVGTVTVLSAAENIAKYPTKRSALFILFTAEEKGLLGSKYYIEHPLIPLNKMVFCFNSDNASYNDTSVATIVGLDRTTAEPQIKSAAEAFGLTAINDPEPEQNLFDRSDNVFFAAKGIPAPTFSLGFTAFDAEVFKYYHQAADNPDNLDYDYLLKFFRAYVLSCRNIANGDKTPFWTEGDKYYDAGKALYDRQ